MKHLITFFTDKIRCTIEGMLFPNNFRPWVWSGDKHNHGVKQTKGCWQPHQLFKSPSCIQNCHQNPQCTLLLILNPIYQQGNTAKSEKLSSLTHALPHFGQPPPAKVLKYMPMIGHVLVNISFLDGLAISAILLVVFHNIEFVKWPCASLQTTW